MKFRMIFLFIILNDGKLAATDGRVETLASIMREITGQLEKFNSLYMNKLDRELSVSSSKLASLESTLRSVADRAVAWDNIQNHMTVWTDQTRTMEKKLDLLNRHHEKQAVWEGKLSSLDALNHRLVNLDKKINTMTRLEFKVEKISERVEEINSKLNDLRDKASISSFMDQQGFGHLAKLGLGSYLSTIESKLDNITKQLNKKPPLYNSKMGNPSSLKKNIHSSAKVGFFQSKLSPKVNAFVPKTSLLTSRTSKLSSYAPKTYEMRNKGSWTIVQSENQKRNQIRTKEKSKCLTCDSKILEDVRAKVDVLFDRFTDPDYEYDYEAFVSNFKREALPATSSEASSKNPFEKSLVRFWKNLVAPIKKMNRKLKSFENQLMDMQSFCNLTGPIFNEETLREAFNSVMESKQDDLMQILKQHFSMFHNSMIDQFSKTNARLESCNAENITSVIRELSPNDSLKSQLNDIELYLRKRCERGHTTTTAPLFYPQQEQPHITTEQPHYATENHPVITTPTLPTSLLDCSDLYLRGFTTSQVYRVEDDSEQQKTESDYFYRYCDQTTDGGGWTVIQRRGRYDISPLNFTKPWDEYKTGFGSLEGEFWFGNDYIHRLTNEHNMVVRFDLWDFEGQRAFAEYSFFRLGPEEDNYRLSVSGYRGNASDSFSTHNQFLFSTFDVNNDEAPDCCPCAPAYGGGWWFYSCFESNLNGEYHFDPTENDHYRGLIWELWLGDYSLKATEIKVRPTSFKKFAFPTPFPDIYPVNATPELP